MENEDEFPAGLTAELDAEPGSENPTVVAKETPVATVEDSPTPTPETVPTPEVVADVPTLDPDGLDDDGLPLDNPPAPEAPVKTGKLPRLRVKDERTEKIVRLTNAGLSLEEAIAKVGQVQTAPSTTKAPEEGSPEAITAELEGIQKEINGYAEREDMITPEYQALMDKKLELTLAKRDAINERKAAEREARQKHDQSFDEQYTAILDAEIEKYPDANTPGTRLFKQCETLHYALRSNDPRINETYKDLLKFRGKPEFGAELLKTAADLAGVQPSSTATGQGAVTTPVKSTTTNVAAKPKGIPVAGAKTPVTQPANAATQEADKIRALRTAEDDSQIRKALNVLSGDDDDDGFGFGGQLR